MKQLNVDGYIVPDEDAWIYDYFGIPSLSPGKIRAFLSDSAGEEIEVRIGTCYGGDVWSASDIYDQLRGYKGKSTARIAALSASAATFMMLGCDKVVATPTAQMMIHCASSYAEGNHIEMEKAAQRLKTTDESILNAYEIKTKKSRSDLSALMEAETWFAAQDMLDMGFIDEIDTGEESNLISAVASLVPARAYASLDPAKMHEIAAKIKAASPSEDAKPKQNEHPTEWQERASALLNIEKMRF